MSEPLELWVVYDRPKDYPQHFVARLWLNDQPTERVIVDNSLTGLRRKLPPELYRMPRDPSDDPRIVESWI